MYLIKASGIATDPVGPDTLNETLSCPLRPSKMANILFSSAGIPQYLAGLHYFLEAQ
jgi:hypothetical protein